MIHRALLGGLLLLCGCFLERSIYIGGYDVKLPVGPKGKVFASTKNWTAVKEELIENLDFKEVPLNKDQEALQPRNPSASGPTVVFTAHRGDFSMSIIGPEETEKIRQTRAKIE